MALDHVKDSGERETFRTGSVRDTQKGRGRYDLLPPYPIQRLAQHYENGAVKYGDNNWKLGQPTSRTASSALRHLFNWLEGDRSEDHLAAAAWNVFTLIWTEHEVQEGRLPSELLDIEYIKPAPNVVVSSAENGGAADPSEAHVRRQEGRQPPSRLIRDTQ